MYLPIYPYKNHPSTDVLSTTVYIWSLSINLSTNIPTNQPTSLPIYQSTYPLTYPPPPLTHAHTYKQKSSFTNFSHLSYPGWWLCRVVSPASQPPLSRSYPCHHRSRLSLNSVSPTWFRVGGTGLRSGVLWVKGGERGEKVRWVRVIVNKVKVASRGVSE